MPTLEAISEGIQTIKKGHADFIEGPFKEYQDQHRNAVGDVMNALQGYTPRVRNLILRVLQENKRDNRKYFDDYIDSPVRNIEIPLDLPEVFHVGYSTNVDLELEKDFIGMELSTVLDVKREDKKDLFKYRKGDGNHIINNSLGKLKIQTNPDFLEKNNPKKPNFHDRFKISPFNMIGLSPINRVEWYNQEHSSLSDQLAYHFYTHTTQDVEHFLWQGDDHNYYGINGLSEAIAILLRGYVEQGKDTYEKYIEMYLQENIMRSQVIEDFNKVFDGYLSLDVKSKPRFLVYKLGPKLKQ